MNRNNSTLKKNRVMKANKSNDIIKIYNALKKLTSSFDEDPHLMLSMSEYLIKENTLNKRPNPCNVCNWVLRHANILITTTDARSLLTYIDLQLSKNPTLKHCSLLPPSRSEYEQWRQNFRTNSKLTYGDNSYEDVEDIQVYSVDNHKLKKKQSRHDLSLTKLQGKQDPTLHMFPSILKAKNTQSVPHSTTTTRTNEISPIKFKETSTSMKYKKYGSFNDGGNTNKPISVTDMVALARKKQHYERIQRQQDEEMKFGKNSIDYGLVDKRETKVPKSLPKLKEISYHEQIDKQLFGDQSKNKSINNFGIYGSPNSNMSKAKPRFHRESVMVTNEVYEILGVRSDKTIRPRKY